MKRYVRWKSPIGYMILEEEDGLLIRISFSDRLSDRMEETTPLLLKTIKQLEEYFGGQRRIFDLPLNPQGTEFQKKVWSALEEIPYGETRSYKEIAVRVGNPAACRAVGMANNRNPIAIIIPCHRVIGANGDLTGYAGGLDIKRRLLAIESEF